VRPADEHESAHSSKYRLATNNTTIAAPADKQEQNLGFKDSNAGYDKIISAQPDPTFDTGNFRDAELGEFLKRPIKIFDTTWPLTNELNVSFNPWEEYFTNSTVAKKIDNYARLRCNLKVKLVINATPFHYGRAIMHYNPWDLIDQTRAPILGDQEQVTLFSQRPKIFINPTDNSGGTLTIPFFHYNNWLNLTSLTDIQNMGRMYITSINPLQHASGGTQSISVSVFAWAEDVKLCVPTAKLSAQAGRSYKLGAKDEYGDGIISKPASAIAKMAGAITNLPGIGPFAMATKIAASGVSDIAKLFGFSRPPILTNTSYYKPAYASNLACTDQSETVSKLTVDSKQELTIDPRTVGLSGVDELSIKSIAQRESFLTSFTWNTTTAVEARLWNVQIAPMLENYYSNQTVSTISFNTFYPTALSFCTWPFSHWTGTIKLRFQVVCSKFHRGRLLFKYEPHSGSDGDSTNVNYCQVVDIGEEDDVEMCISMASNQPWLETAWSKTGTHYRTTNLDNLDGFSNGVLHVFVLNELTAPVDTANVQVNVYVSAGDDFELANPSNGLVNTHYRKPVAQSARGMDDGEMCHPDQADCDMHIVGAPDMGIAEKRTSVFFGEAIVSFRQILRRYNRYRSWPLDRSTLGADSLGEAEVLTSYVPLYSGEASVGVDLDSAGNPVNYTTTSIMSYLMPAFVAMRGSMRHKFRCPDNYQYGSINASRIYGNFSNDSIATKTLLLGTDSPSFVAYRASLLDSGTTGTIIQPYNLSPIAEVEQPFATGKRFAFTRNIISRNTLDDAKKLGVKSTVSVVHAASKKDGIMEEFRAVGEDFNLFFFINAPIRYEYAMKPP
jgi:hypothetical protein